MVLWVVATRRTVLLPFSHGPTERRHPAIPLRGFITQKTTYFTSSPWKLQVCHWKHRVVFAISENQGQRDILKKLQTRYMEKYMYSLQYTVTFLLFHHINNRLIKIGQYDGRRKLTSSSLSHEKLIVTQLFKKSPPPLNYCIHKSPPLGHIRSHFNPILTMILCTFKMDFNVTSHTCLGVIFR
jgi:hypothetical protein